MVERQCSICGQAHDGTACQQTIAPLVGNWSRELPPVGFRAAGPVSRIATALEMLAKQQARHIAQIDKVIEILEAKPRACSTCGRVSGHQEWCKAGS